MPVAENCITHYEISGDADFLQPPGLANGNRLVAFISWEATIDPPLGLPPGWAHVAGSPIVDSTFAQMGLYVVYKDIVDAGSEPASYNFPFSAFHWGIMVRVSDPGPMALFGNSRALEANSDVEILTGFTAAADNCLALGAVVDYAHGGLTPAPSGWAGVTGNGGRFLYQIADLDTGTVAEASTGRFGTVMWVNAVLVIQPPGAGGSSLTQTPADPIGLTDSVMVAVGRANAPADPVGITDTVSIARDVAHAVADAVGLTDSVSVLMNRAAQAVESVGITDSVTVAVGRTHTPLDPVGITDAVSVAVGRVAVPADAVGITDVVLIARDIRLEIADALGIADSAAVGVAGAGAHDVGDTVGITDTVDIARDIRLVIVDAIGVTDTADVTRAVVVEIIDALGVTDAVVFAGPPEAGRIRLGSIVGTVSGPTIGGSITSPATAGTNTGPETS